MISATYSSIKRSIPGIAVLLLLFSSCRVQFVPDYEAELSRHIEATAETVDHFYLSMLEKTRAEDSGRAYVRFADAYIDIEVELNALLNKNRVRPLNQNSTRIGEIALQIWSKYKAEHKEDNTISNGVIILNRKYMNDLFYTMRVAEEAKKMASTLNQ